MKTHGRSMLALLFATAALCSVRAAAYQATVTADRVNVRGKASLNSEIVTQLREGESVLVLEQIPVANPKGGEPSAWARIQLPANTPVWVFAPYIEPTQSIVNVSRLNLRAGPGEQYSVLGRIERGTPVKEIRVEKNWMEIEAPQGTYAYVAVNFLSPTPGSETGAPGVAATSDATTESPAQPPPSSETSTSAPAQPATGDVAATTPDSPPPSTQPVEIEPAPAAPVDQTTATTAPAPTTDTAQTQATDQLTPPEPPQRRIVSREGRVIISRSIQAPTDYSLESLDTRRTINYLHSEDLGVNLKVYAGRKVIVEGEELMDERWTRTPIIEVERIRLVP